MKLPDDFDWRNSNGHMDLLTQFLRPRDIVALSSSKNEYSKRFLNELPKVAINRFIKEGAILDCELDECLVTIFSVANLKSMCKENGLKLTGTKSELSKRLVDANRQGIESLVYTVHNKKFMKCSSWARDLVDKYKIANEEALNSTKQRSYVFFLAGDAKKAYKVFIEYQRQYQPSAYIPSRPYDIEELDYILTSKPEVLNSMGAKDLNGLRAAVCMKKLWYDCSVEAWLPDDFIVPLKSIGVTVNLLESNAKFRNMLDIFRKYAKKIKLVFDDYDVDSCEHCLALNGKTIDLDESFELPLENCTSGVGCQCQIEVVRDESEIYSDQLVPEYYFGSTSGNDFDSDSDEDDAGDAFSKLTQLKKMLEYELITKDDYEEKKAEILSRI